MGQTMIHLTKKLLTTEGYRPFFSDSSFIKTIEDREYVDVSKTFDFMKKVAPKQDEKNLLVNAEFLAIIREWKKYKQIYRFTPELIQELFSSEPINKLPAAALMSLPYPSFYIDGPFQYEENAGEFIYIDGIFVAFGYDREANKRVLLLSCLFANRTDGLFAARFDLSAETLEKSIMRRNNEKEITFMQDLLSGFMPLLLYLCSEEPDIKPVKKKKKKSGPKPELSGVKESDVGKNFAVRFRIEKKKQASQAESTETIVTRVGSKKSPHMRKAHWHHFWVGKRGEERRLILRWMHPIYVAGKNKENETITITRLEK